MTKKIIYHASSSFEELSYYEYINVGYSTLIIRQYSAPDYSLKHKCHAPYTVIVQVFVINYLTPVCFITSSRSENSFKASYDNFKNEVQYACKC